MLSCAQPQRSRDHDLLIPFFSLENEIDSRREICTVTTQVHVIVEQVSADNSVIRPQITNTSAAAQSSYYIHMHVYVGHRQSHVINLEKSHYTIRY